MIAPADPIIRSAVPPRNSYFATCAPGLEPLLHAELRALKMARVERQTSGVAFEGSLEDAWRANLELRTAIRVLMRLARFPARDADELYAGARELDWSRFFGPGATLAVTARSRESQLDHTLFVAQRVKDAVVDQMVERTGARPSVDLDAPSVRLYAHLFRDRCSLFADTSGESLHKRGWRRFQGRAPLAETLAAAVVMLSRWDRRAPLVDPFCGSGTLLVEAALLAADHAPGLFRARFGFEGLPGFDRRAWEAMREAARKRAALPNKLVLRGSDADAAAIEGARANLAAAELEARVELEVAHTEDFAPRSGWNAWIVTNPPYGERVGEARELEPVYEGFGARLREHCAGYHLALLSGNARLAERLRLRTGERIPLKNGALDCELLLAELR